jgi:hypothetical protein
VLTTNNGCRTIFGPGDLSATQNFLACDGEHAPLFAAQPPRRCYRNPMRPDFLKKMQSAHELARGEICGPPRRQQIPARQ